MLRRIGFVTVLLVATSFGMFLWGRERGLPIEVARTAAVNTVVMREIFYLFNCRRLTASILSREGFLGNPRVLQGIGALLALQLLFTHLPLLQGLFHTADLDPAAWLRSVAAGVLVLLAVEAEKVCWRRRTGP